MARVEVESKAELRRDRTDITFFCDGEPYGVELKTANTHWRVPGVNSAGRPITKNVQSIIDDAVKLNSPNGIVAFVFFPVPVGDGRWEAYLNRINEKLDVGLNGMRNCQVVNVRLDEANECSMVVCTFRSRRFLLRITLFGHLRLTFPGR